jgi:hypothetical protein
MPSVRLNRKQDKKDPRGVSAGAKGQQKSRYGFFSVSALFFCTTTFGGE